MFEDFLLLLSYSENFVIFKMIKVESFINLPLYCWNLLDLVNRMVKSANVKDSLCSCKPICLEYQSNIDWA